MTDKVFKEKYAKLNREQREAVDTIEGPVMVIAGPGTGKTTLLTLRIANILQKTDTPASGILAITFTEAGVKAMRMKLRAVIVARSDEVRIHTFHGFAASIIAEFADHFPHIARAEQLTDVEAQSVIRSILKDSQFAKLRPLGEPEFYVDIIVRSISEAKKEAWTPDMIRSFATEEIERVKNDPESISTRGATKGELKADTKKRIEKCEKTLLFADVYAAYEQRKKDDKKIDFDDLIIELLVALKNDELLLRSLQEKFLYLLVDEHQDTNDSQNLLIRMLADFFETPNLFVVGDEKQAIYRFQGASVENFLRFQNIWQSMKVISLTSNYRSHQNILDAGFSLIENNYSEGEHTNLRVKLSAGSDEEPKPIDIVSAGNVEASENYLVSKLREIIARESGTTSQKTVALITRTNRDVERLIALLEREGIPAAAERGADIFSHPLGILFFNLIKCIADPGEIESLAYTLAHGLWNMSFTESARRIKSIRAGVPETIPTLEKIRSDINRSGALEFLINAADISGYSQIAAQNPLSAEVWRGIVALATDITKRGSIEDPHTLISELLEYQKSAEGKSVKVFSGTSDASIRIMTAHSSKGLEYDYVFIPYATEESWMSRARATYFIMPRERTDGDDIRDARRLFYVALTRARKHVTIMHALVDETGRELVPLRFVSEIDAVHTAWTDILSLESAHAGTRSISLDTQRKTELVEFAKNTLLEKGLSVTALNHFCECPSLFFYKSILKLPEPPAASSEKGNAMHEAIAAVWQVSDKSQKSITETLENNIRLYFTRSLLSKFEKEAAERELLAAAPAVARALGAHFALSGTVSTESWFETTFGDIRLHGKLDAVIDQDSKVLVFDYKTRGALTPAAIKGETKGSDRNYFRQLVFYKILLESNPRFKGKDIQPALIFVKPDEKGRCAEVALTITQADIDGVKAEIQALVGSVWSGKMLEGLCDDEKCEWCRMRKMK